MSAQLWSILDSYEILYSSIAACRLVMRLQEFNQKGPDVYVHSAAQMSDNTPRGQLHFSKRFVPTRVPEVMVTTDQIVMEDFR